MREKFSQEQRATLSITAGKSFGRLIALNNPGWTLEKAETFCSHLKPRAPFLVTKYKRAFLAAFEEEHERIKQKKIGNPFPILEEKIEVSRFSEIKKRTQSSDFVKPATLVENEIAFSIIGIRFGQGFKNKKQWYLTIRPYPMEDTDLGLENGLGTLTLSEGARDSFMQGLKEDIEKSGPLHNMFIDELPMADGTSTFYDLAELVKGDKGFLDEKKIEELFKAEDEEDEDEDEDEEEPEPRQRTTNVRKAVAKQREMAESQTVRGKAKKKVDAFLPDDDDEDYPDDLPPKKSARRQRSTR